MGIDAVADAKAILENSVSGFGQSVVLTSPAGVAATLTGKATDVSESIDPETGLAVAGRRASVALSLLSLPVLPEAVHEPERRPWLVSFVGASGVAATWKVAEVRPDRRVGVVVLILEGYAAAD